MLKTNGHVCKPIIINYLTSLQYKKASPTNLKKKITQRKTTSEYQSPLEMRLLTPDPLMPWEVPMHPLPVKALSTMMCQLITTFRILSVNMKLTPPTQQLLEPACQSHVLLSRFCSYRCLEWVVCVHSKILGVNIEYIIYKARLLLWNWRCNHVKKKITCRLHVKI